MTISYSSRITTRGLTFAVDAGSTASLSTNINRNLITQPENLSNVLWSKTSVDVALTTTLAPNGTATVYSVTEQATSAQHLLSYSFGTVAINDTFTWSGHFKNNANCPQIILHTNGEGTVTFNISGVLAGTVSIVAGSGTLSGAISDAGNGWYRCSAVFKKANTTGTFYVANQNGLGVYTGATNTSYFAWGLQLEYNTAVSPYYPVTTTASALNTRWYDITNTSRPMPRSTSLSSVEVLVVAGGGGGGADVGGGGGGGGVVYNAMYPITVSTNYTVTVGAGGIGGTGPTSATEGSNGGNSIFDTIIAYGGGAGGRYATSTGYSGGSGGGSPGDSGGSFLVAGKGASGQGYPGGIGTTSSVPYGSGGGGGAGGPGGNTTAAGGGNGGPGYLSNISGTSVYYGSGGAGGGGNDSNSDGRGFPATPGGGIGAARSGQYINMAGLRDGTANTGGGGGGTGGWNTAGNGGSGVVIVRYPGPQQATGGTVTSVNGFTIHTFTSGTSTFSLYQTTTGYDYQTYGTFQNNVTYDSRNGGALVFDNNTSYVAMPELPAQTNSPLSVFAWVYLNATPAGTNGIWGHMGVAGNCHFEFYPTYGRLRLGDINTTSLPAMTVGSWQYVGFTSDGTNHSYYVNGALSTTWSGTTGTILGGNSITFPSSHQIGRSDATRVWNGRIAHLTINSVQLTAAEVLNNYNALRGRYGV